MATGMGDRLQLCVMTMLVLSLNGCVADSPKPAPTVTPEQVRSHSDNAFQKLKQEEGSAGTGRATPR